MTNLSGRKEKILKSLIEDYLVSATPVSSSEIRAKHLPDLSSATIRNELAALEEMGYLYQPHTSSGRVPTAQAYEEYVARMMPRKKLTREETKLIKQHFNSRMSTVKDVLKSTAHVISEVTHYTSLACVNDISDATVTNIKIVRLTPSSALVIVVTTLGVLKDAVVETEEDYGDEYYDAVSRIATETFGNRTIREVMKPNKLIKETIREYRRFFDAILDILKKYGDEELRDVVLDGTSKILEYPEYSNVAKAKQMLETLDAKQEIIDVLKRDEDTAELRVRIAKEAGDPLSDCAIVTVDYKVDGRSIGKAGVIGPLRMDYPKVISVLDYVAKIVEQSSLPSPEEDGDEQE